MSQFSRCRRMHARCVVWVLFAAAPTAASAQQEALRPPATASPDEAPEPPSPAQEAAPPTDPAPPAITAPVLETDSPIAYPDEAHAEGVTGRVVLSLVLDDLGTVREVSVVEGLCPACDAAALTAARGLVFRPATRDGAPVGARILFAYELAPPPDASPTDLTASRPAAAAPPTEVAASRPPAPVPATPIEVTVQGESDADRLRHSAHAVDVIGLEDAQQRGADLGEVLARSRGMTVQRAGALGSETRLSLHGFEGEQIRIFLDGVPLDYAGFSFGFANVPVNLVERVEIYRGVVPTRFGADALGGAIDLVTDDDFSRNQASLSYQGGSFDTHRLTAQSTLADATTGLFVRANAFLDGAENDYPMRVDVPDDAGRLSEARVHRFHDAYAARGVGLEAGVAQRPYAKRLSLRAFYASSEKELQHDPLMITPYGAANTATESAGAYARYEQRWGRLGLAAVLGYAYGATRFVDVSSCIYDWFGRCARERAHPGEIDGANDSTLDSHAAHARATLSYAPATNHTLRLSVAPELVVRDGDERVPATTTGVSAFDATRRMTTAVSGVEYEAKLFDADLQNIAFVKSYLQRASSERPLPIGGVEQIDNGTSQLGAGSALRYRVAHGVLLKASYEYATRLPRPDEVFGDGVLTEANLDLAPETSHNVNLGTSLQTDELVTGRWQAEVNGFYRDATELIRRVGSTFYFRFDNVASTRTVGVETTLRWASPREYVVLDATGTLQDARNTAGVGRDAAQNGDRIPNRPYLFGTGNATVQQRGFVTPSDRIALTWSSRYVHAFFRTWESRGSLETKPKVPDQLVHSLSLVYGVTKRPRAISAALELQNLTDARIYDFFGVQRPGRAAFFKTTIEL